MPITEFTIEFDVLHQSFSTVTYPNKIYVLVLKIIQRHCLLVLEYRLNIEAGKYHISFAC